MAPRRNTLRLATYAAITLLALRYTVRRTMTEEPIRTFDWWMLAIEVGVFLLVAYEVGATIYHQIQGAKRRKGLREIEATLQRLIASGEEIKRAVPDSFQVQNLDWHKSVDIWAGDVEAYLAPLSSRALSEFNSYANPNQRYREYRTRQGHIMHASGYTGDMLETLNMKLESLRRIAQRCDDYF